MARIVILFYLAMLMALSVRKPNSLLFVVQSGTERQGQGARRADEHSTAA